MLEKMDAFFEARLDGYDHHMLTNIESAQQFYAFTAKALPAQSAIHLLDLGCGTGLELEYFLRINPTAQITGIDLSQGMLDALEAKLKGFSLTLIHGSYFDVPLGSNQYDAAVSVESLHHFTQAEKIPLYSKLHASLKPDGYFILTDYFANTEQEEKYLQNELIALKQQQGIDDHEFYHFDTPLTVQHEIEALKAAGFSKVEELRSWGATHTLKAWR